MNYATVASGISAETQAWKTLGWKPVFFSEIDPFASAILKHHYPTVPNYGDMNLVYKYARQIRKHHAPIDLLAGGTPCQSFSVAGLRKGMDDPRGNLSLIFLGIAQRFRPRWIVWENVPGLLSSNKGRDFGSFLGALAQLGYGFAYRVLDAQHFGVPQQRRRVFVIGYFGNHRPAAAVLFDTKSSYRNTQKSRKAGQIVAALTATGVGTCGADDNQAQAGHLVIDWPAQVSCTLDATFSSKYGQNKQHAEQGASLFVPGVMSTGQSNAEILFDKCSTITNNHDNPMVFQPRFLRNGYGSPKEIASTITAHARNGDSTQYFIENYGIRRITPIEAERLQGFPDDYTKIRYRGKQLENCPDGPRYKVLGNSQAVPVQRWIGERIMMMEEVLKEIGK